MRWIVLAFCLPTYAAAWEFSPAPLCTLSHQSQDAHIMIVHDPSVPEYSMTLNLAVGTWVESDRFSIAFLGGRSMTISTDRHVTENAVLSVADGGFGNVLNGLEFNQTAIAFTPEQSLTLTLAGAAPEVRKFRNCILQEPPTS